MSMSFRQSIYYLPGGSLLVTAVIGGIEQADAFKEDVLRCIDAGMDEHLAKPMSAEALVGMLKKHLGLRQIVPICFIRTE